MKLKNAKYASEQTKLVGRLLDSALEERESGADVAACFDSVDKRESSEKPKVFMDLIERMPEGTGQEVLSAVMDGVNAYTKMHGEAPRADMIESALQQGLSVFDPRDANGDKLLDSATSAHHDQISLQPNRAVTAIIRTIAEAIPFAGYLPVDIGSNQSKLIILQTRAGSDFGDFQVGGTLEGVKQGGAYSLASRFATLTSNGGAGPFNVQFFTRNLADGSGEPDPTASAVPVLRGRTNLYVNGIPAGGEARTSNSTAANSPINGSVVIAGVTYTLTGQVTPATGAVSVSSNPGLPAGFNAYVEGFIDFDAQPGLIPMITVEAVPYDVFAVESRIYTANAFGASRQMQNEAGVDPEALATGKFQDQLIMERHYKMLRQARIQGLLCNYGTFNLNFTTRGAQLVRAQILQDLAAEIGARSQQMANDTLDHGITHIYTGAYLAAVFDGCPDYIWKSAGVPKRAGIYKLGTLFSMYEVYYAPNVVQESADENTSELLCLGTSTQPARNPFVMGDAVPPTMIPLSTNPDLKRQAAMYSREFTQMNPHVVSARGCALIKITGLQTS